MGRCRAYRRQYEQQKICESSQEAACQCEALVMCWKRAGGGFSQPPGFKRGVEYVEGSYYPESGQASAMSRVNIRSDIPGGWNMWNMSLSLDLRQRITGVPLFEVGGDARLRLGVTFAQHCWWPVNLCQQCQKALTPYAAAPTPGGDRACLAHKSPL